MKPTLDDIVSLAKRRGFIFQGSEIYGGMSGTWDYGPLGVLLKENIKKVWREHFVKTPGPGEGKMFEIDGAILMNPRVWEASGHVATFSDPLVECEKCKKRFRADHLRDKKKCEECGGALGEPRQFNMMFKTQVGAVEDTSSVAYLRPETAQAIFTNFKNILDTFAPKLPFGIAQIGKAFRNEITPRDFVFRTREFEQMEIEYFVKEGEWKILFEEMRKRMIGFYEALGLRKENLHELEVLEEDLAHYSKRTIDFEYEYPFGRSELWGFAYRTDYDLQKHKEFSGAELSYYDEEEKNRFVPHVLEPSFGLDRTVLALLSDAYRVDTLGGEERAYLALSPKIAPIKIAVFPLVKNKTELVSKAREIYTTLNKNIGDVSFDDNGNIGKRYRRQDEIGTPFCVTVDYETLENGTVTLRDRNTGEQKRLSVSDLSSEMETLLR